MRRTRRQVLARLMVLAVLLASVVGVVAPTPALAATECRGEIGAVTIEGNLVVPDGAGCALIGTTVTGNVRGDAFQRVLLDHGTVVGGTVVLTGGTFGVSVCDSRVGGRVELTGSNLDEELAVADTAIGGTLIVAGNRAGDFTIFRNTVGGILRFDNNAATFGGNSDISDNEIRGSLRCEGNDPPPLDFEGDNTVGGRKTGQCADL